MEINYFLLGTTFILMHEMDAMRCREWRILPGLSLLSDQVGMISFVFLHVPLFYWVLLEIQTNNEVFVRRFDIFLIVHFFLHIMFLLHKNNEFKDWISWSIISGAGLCGAVDLVVR